MKEAIEILKKLSNRASISGTSVKTELRRAIALIEKEMKERKIKC